MLPRRDLALLATALAAALFTTLAACAPMSGPEPDPATFPVVRDLAVAFPAAEVHREVEIVDFGTPEARDLHLAGGWYAGETSRGGGTSFVWSRGDASTLSFYLAAPRDLVAEVRCAPVEAPGVTSQAVTPVINGRSLPEVPLAAGGMQTTSFSLPAAALQAGVNRLTLRYSTVVVPAEAGLSRDRRRLAVAWDLLRLRPGGAAGEPRAVTSEAGWIEAALLLPFASEAAFYLELDGDALFTFAGLEACTAGGGGAGDCAGRLEVAARPEAGEEQVLAVFEGGAERAAVPLPGEGRRLLRLALRAVPETPGAVAGSLRVTAPRVRSRPPPEPPAPPPSRPVPGPAVLSAEVVGESSQRRPHVVVYLVDTLRADRLGAYGYPRPVSPHFDAFAEGALLFEDAVAQSPWTRPSVATLLTGLGPLEHGVRTLEDRLPAEVPTLAERLRAAGYATAAFSTNWHVSEATGFGRGFDDFVFFPHDPRSDAVNRRVFSWLDEHRDDRREGRPFFLYVHALDPHAPYEPPAEERRRFASEVTRPGAGSRQDLQRVYAARGREQEELIASLQPLYDAEIAFNDKSFGELIAGLRQRGIEDDTLVVFVSDHGEQFGEHGALGHANGLHREELQVPLAIRLPGQRRGLRVPGLAQHLDLVPTLIARLGLPAGDRPLPGADLLRLAAAGGVAATPRAVFSHLDYDGRVGMSAVRGRWKLVEPWSRALAPEAALYDRESDPGETVDLLDLHPVRGGHLAALLRAERWRSRGAPAAEPARLDEAARRGLEALGYL